MEPGLSRPANRLLLREPGEPAPAKLRVSSRHLVLADAAFPVGVEPGERGEAVVDEDDRAQIEIERRIAERLR